MISPKFLKIGLMFFPLLIGFLTVIAVTLDLKNPQSTSHYQCQVLAVGDKVASHKNQARLLYGHGTDQRHDIAFACNNKLGHVWINDIEPFSGSSISQGNTARIRHVTYNWMPEVWRVNVENNGEDCGELCKGKKEKPIDPDGLPPLPKNTGWAESQ